MFIFSELGSAPQPTPGSSLGRSVTPRCARPQAEDRYWRLNPGRHEAFVAPLRGGQKASRVSSRGEFKVTPLSRPSSVAAARPQRELYMDHGHLFAVYLYFLALHAPARSPRGLRSRFYCCHLALYGAALWPTFCVLDETNTELFFLIYFFFLFPALSRFKCKAASQLSKALWVIHLSLQADQGHNLTKLHKSR